jgi:hypothetical protein
MLKLSLSTLWLVYNRHHGLGRHSLLLCYHHCHPPTTALMPGGMTGEGFLLKIGKCSLQSHSKRSYFIPLPSLSLSVAPLLTSPESPFGTSVAKLINSCTFSHLVAQSWSLCFKYSSYFTKSTKRRMRSAGEVSCPIKYGSEPE